MLEALAGRPAGRKKADPEVRILACLARVFVEANDVTAGVEALVIQEGACSVPRVKLVQILRTFHPKQNLIIEASANGLKIGGFTMPVIRFSSEAQAPGRFNVYPVTDAWLVKSGAEPRSRVNHPPNAPGNE